MSTHSILLVEDHPGFAKALLTMLSQNESLQIVAVATSAEEALEQLRNQKVDLIIIDYSLPEMSGINLVKTLQEEYPDLLCVMLSGHLSTQYARRALEAGARGYLIKDNPLGIIEGIQNVLQGEVYLSEELRKNGPTDLLMDFP